MKEMKFLNRYMAVLFGAFTMMGLAACGEKEPSGTQTEVEINIEVNPLEISFPADGGTMAISVDTDASGWDCMAAASWIEAEISDDEILVTASANTMDESRSAEIVVFAFEGDAREEVKVVVSQEAAKKEDNGSGNEGEGGLVDGNIVFECPIFKELMVSYCDVNGDGEISLDEAARVTELSVSYNEEDETSFQITSLKGIEYFVNLVYLECDLNALTSLNLSGLKKLEYVDCTYNNITDLNMSGCESLKWLYFYSNDVVTLNIEGCDALMFIQGYKNKVRKMDVSGLKELVYFDMRLNELEEVELSDCPKMYVAALGDNNIASLDLTGLPELYTLGCYGNVLSNLDVSALPKLQMLECYNNNLLSLDLSSNPFVTMLTCQNNMISDLKIEVCTQMKVLDCGSNRLSGDFDASIYPAMERLYCGGNEFESVDVTGCGNITDLTCANTNITALDVADCPLLKYLICNDCLLETLDVSANLKLEKLHAQGNPLTSLILAEGQVIKDLKIDDHDVISYK